MSACDSGNREAVPHELIPHAPGTRLEDSPGTREVSLAARMERIESQASKQLV